MASLSDAGLALNSASQQDLIQRKLAMDALRNRLGDVKSKETELRESCEGFESVFLQKMWEQMRNNVNKEGYLHSKDEEMYQSMFDVELAKKMASAGGIGLADMLYEQLSAQTSSAGRSTVPVASMPARVSGADTSHTTQDMLSQAQALPATRQKNGGDLTASYLYAAPTAGQATADQATPGTPLQGQESAPQNPPQGNRPENQTKLPEDTILAALHDLRMATTMPAGTPAPQEVDPWASPALNPHMQTAEFALPSMTTLRPDQGFSLPSQKTNTPRAKNTGKPTEGTGAPEQAGLHGTSWNLPDNGPISAQPKPLPLRGNRSTIRNPEDVPTSAQAHPTARPGAQNPARNSPLTPEQTPGIPEMTSLGSAPFTSSPERETSAITQGAAPAHGESQTLAQSPFSLTLDEARASSYGFKRRI